MISNRHVHGVVLAATFIVSSACAPTGGPAGRPAQPDLACSTSQSKVNEQLKGLNAATTQDRTRLLTYSRAVHQMLVACDAEVRTMNVTLADDWKIQSFSIRKDLERLERAAPDTLREMLPLHRRRVERLIATYTAMYGNLPLDR